MGLIALLGTIGLKDFSQLPFLHLLKRHPKFQSRKPSLTFFVNLSNTLLSKLTSWEMTPLSAETIVFVIEKLSKEKKNREIKRKVRKKLQSLYV